MRFIIREQEYEKLQAAGKFRYMHDGQPTGLEEQWRVTAAAEGYYFLRVDVDGREAGSGASCLYHLAFGPKGRPERMKLRCFGPSSDVIADYLLDEQIVTAIREVSGRHFEQVLEVPSAYVFWFQSALGLSLLARAADGANLGLVISPDEAADFALLSASAEIQWYSEETMVVTHQRVEVRPCLVRWLDQRRKVWLDRHGWPVRLQVDESLEAVETQYVRVTH